MAKTKTTQFSLDETEDAFFKAYAKRKGLTLSALSRMALFQYVERFPKKGLSLDGMEEKVSIPE